MEQRPKEPRERCSVRGNNKPKTEPDALEKGPPGQCGWRGCSRVPSQLPSSRVSEPSSRATYSLGKQPAHSLCDSVSATLCLLAPTFSNNVCSFYVSGSHFGTSRHISNVFTLIVFATVICGQLSLMLLL